MSEYSLYSSSDKPPKYDEFVPEYEEYINCNDFDKSKLIIGPFDRKIFRKCGSEQESNSHDLEIEDSEA